MLKELFNRSTLKSGLAQFGAAVVYLSLCTLTLFAAASGQQVQLDSFPSPGAINANGETSTTATVSGFSGSVALSCQVTPASSPAPICQVSPTSVASPGSATVTVQGNDAPAGTYSIAITATAAGTAPQTAARDLSILSVAPSFTITVTTPVTPSSVHAGNAGEGVITVNPINGYSSPGGLAGVTLSCSSMTPLVTIPPVCSFTYASGMQGVVITGGAPNTATITINTFGPVTTGAVAKKRMRYYATWLPLPLLALVGLAAAAGGRRGHKAWGLLALFVVSGSILLTPACGNNTGAQTTTPNGITPNNAYTFTVTGVDINGTTSSNTSGTGATTGNPTVTLTVN